MEKQATIKNQLPKFSCGADDVLKRFSALIERNINQAKARMDDRNRISRIGSQRVKPFVIYLDADGETITNTYWNNYVQGAPIKAAASSLSLEKLRAVQKAVADDYSPWLIEVTLDEKVYNAADPYYRSRCILTESSEWLCGDDIACYGGIAFLGSGFWGDNTPCFVFTNGMSGIVKFVVEAVSHELGHTLGLAHQSVWDASCQKIAEYNEGYGYGPTSFAPIMGVGYYARITNWFTGTDTYSCTDIQNDFQSISRYIPVTQDLEGKEIANGFIGLLNYGGDVDINDIMLKGGGTTIRVTSDNADLKITLYRKGGKLVAANTNAFDTDAKLFVKAGGKFKLKIEAVSNENVSRQFMTGKYLVSIR